MSNLNQGRHGGDYTPRGAAAIDSNSSPIQIEPVQGAHASTYAPGVPPNTGNQIWPTANQMNYAAGSSHTGPMYPAATYYGAPSGVPYGQPQMVSQSQPIYGAGPASPVEDEKSKGRILSNAMSTFSSAPRYHEIPKKLRSSSHIFDPLTSFRFMRIHFFKQPRYVYQSPEIFRHRDYAGRVFEGPRFDRYLHHTTGKLRKLIVTCTDDIYSAGGTSTWRRTYVRNQANLKVRIATWVIDYSNDSGSWETWCIQLLKAFPAAFAMTFCFWSTGAPIKDVFRSYYAPVAYQYHGEAKVWSNQVENRRNSALTHTYQEYRILKPRHLCFLREPQDDKLRGIDIWPVEDWERTAAGRNQNLSYIFVAYSTEQFNHKVEADMEALHHIAETATRAAGAVAYWIAGSCMRDITERVSDVYRIADVLRGAQAMVIAVGQPTTARGEKRWSDDDLLKMWGRRMWTFPEVLLSPGNQISVYTNGGDLKRPLVLSKNQFAGRVWHDADESRQLIDSYLGNLGLSRLELATIAVGCLYRRQTTQYFKGDQAYALMGLLRLRPRVDETDSKFQAFARLSLINDSDILLERYLCTLPLSPDQPWYDMRDAYGSSLWDIYPTCQVAAICDNDTIILDGAHAASIRWKSLFAIDTMVGRSWRRWLAVKLMHWNALVFILACVFLALPNPWGPTKAYYAYYYGLPAVNPFVVVGVIFLLVSVYIWLQTPRLIRTVHGGKFTYTQAALFGIEGYINAATVERAMFGGSFGRMNWSVNGSPLCRSYVNEHGERVAVDPTTDAEVREKVDRARLARPGEMRVFTLIDTYNMQITLFEAVRPPVCIFLCAAEGGMQRAVGCSYDWTTQTMYRETVLRMPTKSLNRMDRVPRFRLGTKRPDWPCREIA